MVEKKLKAFLLGDADTIIAYDKNDAIDVWEKATGEKWNDYLFFEDQTIEELSLDMIERIYFEDNPEKYKGILKESSNNVYETTIEEWIKLNGRGFLCSENW